MSALGRRAQTLVQRSGGACGFGRWSGVQKCARLLCSKRDGGRSRLGSQTVPVERRGRWLKRRDRGCFVCLTDSKSADLACHTGITRDRPGQALRRRASLMNLPSHGFVLSSRSRDPGSSSRPILHINYPLRLYVGLPPLALPVPFIPSKSHLPPSRATPSVFMGREVASAYRRRKYTISSLSLSPVPSRSSSATNSSMESLPDNPDNLTPARKHHKLLKDGSEVWSKDVEKIFVEGLRLYWQSPWATYSRGRSRWRNQFLVDHLKAAGIERTKKQVASHIQVLRNMWRGQPEFQLVAGGEELFQENGLFAHTNNTSGAGLSDVASSSKADAPDSYTGSSSSSSTPEHRATDFPSDLPVSSPYPSLSPSSQLSPYLELRSDDMFPTPVSSPSTADVHFGALPSPSTAHHITPVSVKLEPLAMDPTLFTLPHTSYSDPVAADFALSIPNRISNLYFWADGMLPLSLDVDRLVGATGSSPSRVFLHFRVSMPPLADLRCPPNLQGISGALSLANPWRNIAKCHTKSWGPGRTVISQELGLFTQVSTPELQASLNADPSSSQMVYAYLPDCALSRCHWLDTARTITQQMVVDNEVLAVLVYHIERVTDASRQVPAMELIGFQKYPWRGQPPTSATTSSFQQHLSSPLGSPPVSPHSPTFSQAMSSSPVSPQAAYIPRSVAGSSPVDDLASRMLPYSFPTQQAYGFQPR